MISAQRDLREVKSALGKINRDIEGHKKKILTLQELLPDAKKAVVEAEKSVALLAFEKVDVTGASDMITGMVERGVNMKDVFTLISEGRFDELANVLMQGKAD